MNRPLLIIARLIVICVCCSAVNAQLSSDTLEKIRHERGDHPEADYYDKSLPREIPVKPFEGERYEAEIPDTEELTDYANRALIAMTGLVSPKEEYMTPQMLYAAYNPPIMQLRDGAFVNTGAKWSEALPLMRVMTGNNKNLEIDGKIIGALVRYTGIDGLTYQPVEGRPWAWYDEVNRAVGKPFADVFGDGRQLRTMAVWYQHDHNPLWKRMGTRRRNVCWSLQLKMGTRSICVQGAAIHPGIRKPEKMKWWLLVMWARFSTK